MGTKRNVTISGVEDKVKIVKAVEEKTVITEDVTNSESNPEEKVSKKIPTIKKIRSQKYRAVRHQIDKSKFYSPAEAIALVKKASYSKFVGTITAHVVLKETGEKVTLRFPHSTGKTIRVVIFDDQVLTQIEAGNLDFDILLANPKDMAKLTKHARVLGPKGLMPNPKNGTLIPNPELKKKELEGGKITLATEKKAPLMHVSLGKTTMADQELVENLAALMKVLTGKMLKLSLAPTMGPAVKVVIE